MFWHVNQCLYLCVSIPVPSYIPSPPLFVLFCSVCLCHLPLFPSSFALLPSHHYIAASNGCVCAGGIPAGIYITSTSAACHYISEHSKAALVVLDSNEQLQKYTTISTTLPHLKAIVVWGCEVDSQLAKACSVPVYSWEHFMTLGALVTPRRLYSRMDALRPGHCVSLIYTSGTTGPPKAVMLSHDNVTWSCKIFANQYVTNGMTPGKVVSYLPLSHVAAQMIDINYTFYSGSCAYFAQPDALKGSLSTTLKEVFDRHVTVVCVMCSGVVYVVSVIKSSG